MAQCMFVGCMHVTGAGATTIDNLHSPGKSLVGSEVRPQSINFIIAVLL